MDELIEEEWVTFDALPNYAVSNKGCVLNVRTGRVLKQTYDGSGFLKVALYHLGIRHDAYVHRLVARGFLPDYRDDLEVKFIENKDDCSVSNLTLGEKRRRTGETLW